MEVDRILYEVNEREDLSTRERWEEALNQVKKLRKKGITAFFRNTVAEPPVPAPITKTPEKFYSPVAELTDLFKELGREAKDTGIVDLDERIPLQELKMAEGGEGGDEMTPLSETCIV